MVRVAWGYGESFPVCSGYCGRVRFVSCAGGGADEYARHAHADAGQALLKKAAGQEGHTEEESGRKKASQVENIGTSSDGRAEEQRHTDGPRLDADAISDLAAH